MRGGEESEEKTDYFQSHRSETLDVETHFMSIKKWCVLFFNVMHNMQVTLVFMEHASMKESERTKVEPG